MNHAEKAVDLFQQGYNCAQAVAVAFSDVTGMDADTTARLISAFGGGMGRLREVCGAVSGMFFVTGQLYGYSDPTDDKAKMELYALVQELAAQFKSQHNTIVCRELLKNPPSTPAPTPRTEEFYKTRPCAAFVYTAAEILDGYISQHPVKR